MVKILLTKKVAYHQYAPQYKCLLVVFDAKENKNFMHKGNGVYDWMPKAEELQELFKKAHEAGIDL